MYFLRQVQFEDLELPEVLYKYRNWNNLLHREILTKKEVYFAPHKSFNEVHEHNLEYDVDSMTHERLLNYFLTAANELGIPEADREEFANFHLNNTPLFNPGHMETVKADMDRIFNETRGILSLSPYKDSMTLWNMFANSCMGFVVGLDSNFMFKEGYMQCMAGYVEYYEEDNPPKLNMTTTTDEERIIEALKRIYSLPKRFEDEKEFRLSRTLFDGNRKFKIEQEMYKEIILGHFMTEESKDEIIKLAKKFDNCIVLQQVIDHDHDSISFEKVDL